MRIQEGAYRERPRDAANRHQVVTTHAQAYYRVSDVGGVQLHSRDACGSSHLPRVRWVLGRINLVVATSPPCQFGANPARTLFASLSPCELAMLCRPIQGAAWRRDVQHSSIPRMIRAYSVHHGGSALLLESSISEHTHFLPIQHRHHRHMHTPGGEDRELLQRCLFLGKQICGSPARPVVLASPALVGLR